MKYYVSTEFKVIYLNRILIVDRECVTVCDPHTRSAGHTTIDQVESSLGNLYQEITAEEFINRYFFLRIQ